MQSIRHFVLIDLMNKTFWKKDFQTLRRRKEEGERESFYSLNKNEAFLGKKKTFNSTKLTIEYIVKITFSLLLVSEFEFGVISIELWRDQQFLSMRRWSDSRHEQTFKDGTCLLWGTEGCENAKGGTQQSLPSFQFSYLFDKRSPLQLTTHHIR
jgi:hypothetical protein